TNLDSTTFAEHVDEVFCDALVRHGMVGGETSEVNLPVVAGPSGHPHTLFVAVHREEALLGMLAFGFADANAGPLAGHARLQIARGVEQMAAVALTHAQ